MVPLCLNKNFPLILDCISFYRLTVLSHTQKIEKSNVKILIKVLNRQTDEQDIHTLEDLCAMYRIFYWEVLSLYFINNPSAFLYTHFPKIGYPLLQEKKDIGYLSNSETIVLKSLSSPLSSSYRHKFFILIV